MFKQTVIACMQACSYSPDALTRRPFAGLIRDKFSQPWTLDPEWVDCALGLSQCMYTLHFDAMVLRSRGSLFMSPWFTKAQWTSIFCKCCLLCWYIHMCKTRTDLVVNIRILTTFIIWMVLSTLRIACWINIVDRSWYKMCFIFV